MTTLCEDCPRMCRVDRTKQKGFCLGGDKIFVAKTIKNFMWEEPSLSVKKGVTAIFFSGCNLKCEFCQNEKISRDMCGREFSVKEFASFLEELDREETDGLDFVSPTQFSSLLLEVFALYKPKHKVIWNSNGYEREEIVEKLSPFVSVFLVDFKYSDNNLAVKLSKAPMYKEFAISAIKKMATNKPNIIEKDKMLQGVIVRHLVLPDEIKNSLGVLDEIKNNFPSVFVSLMSQFTPNGKGEKLRKITPLEYKIVLSYFKKIGLENGFSQEISSSNDAFVPNF